MTQHTASFSHWKQSLDLTRAVLTESGMDPTKLRDTIDRLDVSHRLRKAHALLGPPPIELVGDMEGFTDASRVI